MKNLDKVMKWEEAEEFFIEHHLPVIRIVERQNGYAHGEIDKPMRREHWNNWTDALCKVRFPTGNMKTGANLSAASARLPCTKQPLERGGFTNVEQR